MLSPDGTLDSSELLEWQGLDTVCVDSGCSTPGGPQGDEQHGGSCEACRGKHPGFSIDSKTDESVSLQFKNSLSFVSEGGMSTIRAAQNFTRD